MEIHLDNVSFIKSFHEFGEKGELFFHKIADIFPAIILVHNVASNKISFANKRLTEFLGKGVAVGNEPAGDLLHLFVSDDRLAVAQELELAKALKEDQVHKFSARLVDSNEGWKKFDITASIMRKNEQGVAVDLLLIAQEKAETSDEPYLARHLLNETEKFLHSGTFIWQVASSDLQWSDGMYLLFGYDPMIDRNKIKFDPAFYKLHMSDSDYEAARAQLAEALKASDSYTIETAIHTRQGVAKKLATFGRIERLPDGTPHKVIAITRDITSIKNYEKNLQQKIEELKLSNKELEEFAYIASHDLQEPLRKITAFSERLQERSGSELGEDGKMYLQRILSATQNMRILIDNLLEFSRTNRHNDALENIDLNIVLRDVKSDLDLKIDETGAVIEAGSLPSISTYYSQMKQLFTNIVSNAIKFRKHGQAPFIKITSELLSDREKHERSLQTTKRYFKIQVKDSGIGFEQEYAVKIFQIFQRLHGKSEYPGTGIGLAIVKKIVDSHNGIIYAESAPGEGSTFTIILPEN